METHGAIAAALACAGVWRGERVRVHVDGTSMRPLLDVGDAIWIEWAEPASLRPGDVVTVRHDGVLLTHRLVAIDARSCRTKGDNCRISDDPVPVEEIVGRVVLVERRGRLVDLRRWHWMIAGRLVAGLAQMEDALVRTARRRTGDERRWAFLALRCGAVSLRGVFYVTIKLLIAVEKYV